MQDEPGLRVAFVAGLSDKKLAQKLDPLLACPEVGGVELFRRAPYEAGGKLRVFSVSPLGRRFPALGEIERFLRLMWRAPRCDVMVGCFQLYHGVMASLAGLVWGKPVIQLVITDVEWNMKRPLARWAMLGASACGTRGSASSEKLRKRGFSGPLAVIHNPHPPFAPPPPPSRAEGRRDLVAVGDFAVEKDYPLLVEAMRRIKERRGAVSATICGRGFPGPIGPALEHNGLAEDVEFPGHLCGEELGRAYRGSRMLVLSSNVEGLPMVIVEAMAHGLPVVATDVGEVGWLLRNGVEGRLVPPGDAAALSDAVASLLDDDRTRRDMGENARRRVEELAPEFSLCSCVDAWRTLLQVARLPSKGQCAAIDCS